MQVNMKSLTDMKLVHQKLCRLIDQVVLIRGKIIKIRLYPDARRFSFQKLKLVIHPYRLHDHADLMVPVLSFSYYIQP